jgi:hypothetical protein
MMAEERKNICLLVYREETGTEECVGKIHAHQAKILEKIKQDGKIEDIFVFHRNLYGAVYHARTTRLDQWTRENYPIGPGRISILFHPQFVQHALGRYLSSVEERGLLPVVLADCTTLKERKQVKNRSQVERTLLGVRDLLREISRLAGSKVIEHPVEELLR